MGRLVLGFRLAKEDYGHRSYNNNVREAVGETFHRVCGGGVINTTMRETGGDQTPPPISESSKLRKMLKTTI